MILLRPMLVALSMTGLFLLAGCDSQDTDRLVRVGRVTMDKVQSMAGDHSKLFTGLQAVRGDLQDLGLDARVAARLRWDRALADAQIEVHARDGKVELKGKVNSLEQRRRAVELAESTVGADKVVDSLEAPKEE
jgi:osmotically-inducible protein OsmY